MADVETSMAGAALKLVENKGMDKQKALETALGQIERNFGKGSIMRLGEQKTMDVEALSTGSLGLDVALGIGGLPRGRIIEIYGPECSGKTTLALHVIAEAQKSGGVGAFIDAEHALDPVYAGKLGVDLDDLLISQPDTGEQALEIADTLVRSGAIDVLVIGIGRVWQCGTMQVDFFMPERLGAEYVGDDNARHTPVMLHRAIVGSMERFTGILIEHHAGAFPLWLAPVQAAVLSITEKQAAYADSVKNKLLNQGFRVVSDLRNEKISYKIREHSLQKLPYQLVVGDKEMQAETVAVRTRSGEDLGAMSLADFTDRLDREAKAQ
jgi:hypothetical protein